MLVGQVRSYLGVRHSHLVRLVRGFFIRRAVSMEHIWRWCIKPIHPGFTAASDQGGNLRARHVDRSSADLPDAQVVDAAGAAVLT
jgi:hypothetical protein